MLSGRTDDGKMGIPVTVTEDHRLLVRRQSNEIITPPKRNWIRSGEVTDEDVDGVGGTAGDDHLVEAGMPEFRSELSAPGSPHRPWKALVGNLEGTVGCEVGSKAGHDLCTGQDTGIDDERTRRGIGIMDVEPGQVFE
jgi:hypothetical protein